MPVKILLNEEDSAIRIGAILKSRREELGQSKMDLARKAHTNVATINHIENGDGNVTISTIIRIAMSMGLSARLEL